MTRDRHHLSIMTNILPMRMQVKIKKAIRDAGRLKPIGDVLIKTFADAGG